MGGALPIELWRHRMECAAASSGSLLGRMVTKEPAWRYAATHSGMMLQWLPCISSDPPGCCPQQCHGYQNINCPAGTFRLLVGKVFPCRSRAIQKPQGVGCCPAPCGFRSLIISQVKQCKTVRLSLKTVQNSALCFKNSAFTDTPGCREPSQHACVAGIRGSRPCPS